MQITPLLPYKTLHLYDEFWGPWQTKIEKNKVKPQRLKQYLSDIKISLPFVILVAPKFNCTCIIHLKNVEKYICNLGKKKKKLKGLNNMFTTLQNPLMENAI